MSATTLTTAPPEAAGHGLSRAWPALFAVEARRMLRHPAVLGALLIILASWVVPLAGNAAGRSFPDLTSRSWTVQYLMLLLAGGTYIAATLAAQRPRRFGTREFELVLSVPEDQRVAAVAAATAGPALLGGLLAAAQLGVAALMPGAAGSIRWGELLAVPAFIVVAGVAGVVVGLLGKNVAASFLVLAVLAVAGFYGLIADDSRGRWLAFAAGQNPFSTPPLPSALIDRPQWWHLAWLSGLALLGFVATLAVAGARRTRLAVPLVAALAVCSVSAVQQLQPPGAELRARLTAAREAPAAMQICERRGDVSYCAFGEFRSRIGSWAEIVEGQRALLPAGATAPALHVRQHLSIPLDSIGSAMPLPAERWSADDARAGTPNAVPVSTRWSAGGADSFDETELIGFSGLVADRMTGGGATPAEGPTICGARGAVVVWLAASATGDTRAALRTVRSHTSGSGLNLNVLDSLAGIRVGSQELGLADALLEMPPAEVRTRVAANWAGLIDPATTVDRGAEMLGLRAAPQSSSAAEGICG